MASIVGKKQGGKTYYYLVESARVEGKPRIVSQQYLGSAEEVAAKLSGAGAGEPVRTQHKGFGDLAAVWAMLERLDVAGVVDQVAPRRADAAASRRRGTTWSTTSATSRRPSIDHTAARSPKALCWVRTGCPVDAPDSFAATSSALPR
ncbi:MAG: hypothetical protein ACRDVZ_12825, partial [Jiangellaceae bacterium]